jgi:hypothetical protein
MSASLVTIVVDVTSAESVAEAKDAVQRHQRDAGISAFDFNASTSADEFLKS